MEVEQSEGVRFEKYQGVIEYQCAGKGRMFDEICQTWMMLLVHMYDFGNLQT